MAAGLLRHIADECTCCGAMDDVDALIPVIPEHAPPQEQHIIAFVNEFLASVLDWMREKVLPSPQPLTLKTSVTVITPQVAPQFDASVIHSN